MKTKSLMIVVLMIFAASVASAATLSFNPKGGGVVDINVDQAQGIAAAAFTVKYDTNSLVLSDVTSTFFETFAVQKQKAGSTWTSAIPTDLGYDQPLIYENTITGTGTPISAARFKGADAATNATLFTLTFQRKTGVTATSFPISIIASRLKNTDAGYCKNNETGCDGAGEAINLLIGADETKLVTDAAAFPVLLAKNANLDYVFASGNADFGAGAWNLDVDGNGKVEAIKDGLLIYRYLAGARGTSLQKNVGTGATRDVTAIQTYIEAAKTDMTLDVDGNGKVEAIKDGLLIYRYLAGARGTSLQKNVGTGATRDVTAIQTYIEALKSL
jgi:hypothetical protein